MAAIGTFEAKNKLSALPDRVEAGEEITISRQGKPVAQLVPPAMDAELRKPFTMDMVVQEINRYADSEFRYSDKSDDSAVEKMIREARLRERVVGEIEGMKKKGAW